MDIILIDQHYNLTGLCEKTTPVAAKCFVN